MDNKLITQRHVITALEALESEASRSVPLLYMAVRRPTAVMLRSRSQLCLRSW